MKSRSMSLAIREMHLETTMRHQCNPAGGLNRQTDITSVEEGIGRLEPATFSVGMENGAAALESTVAAP